MIDKKVLYSMYESGKTVDEIAEAMNCTRGYVLDLVQRKYGKQSRIDSGKIKALWRAGWSMNAIMKEMHMAEDEVRKVVIHENS